MANDRFHLINGALTDPSPVGYQTNRLYKDGQDVTVVLDAAPVGRLQVANLLP
jgi:hypothetical protein